ncbi:MAG: response regulator transcription factor [Vampirovibrionales bacterium]|nr:response regulator transcription factor [Vampirovibrionales bacterium]
MQHILLIDSEPQIIQDILSLYGYKVDVAQDGYTGIQRFFQNKSQYELLILDIQVPRLNGWSVLKTIRSSDENPCIPILAIIQGDSDEEAVTSLRRGADACLAKPVKASQLLAYVESILRRKQWSANASKKQHKDSTTEELNAAISLLTPRENEILKLLVQGCSNQMISKRLVISETTVKNHLAHIFKKLKVSNRTQAAYMAQKLQMLASSSDY